MNFDIKDVKSWSNRYDVKIGDEGYFFNDIDKLRNFENEYIKPVRGTVEYIRDNYCYCFGIDKRGLKKNYSFFLPLDAVKKDKISDDTSVPNYHLTENKMKHTEKTRINQFLSDLSLTETTIILQSLLTLNHKLLDELADYANTASYDHFEVTKDSLVAVSSMIDKITSVYDVKLMEREEE